MINRVIVAGRIIKNSSTQTTPAGTPMAVVTLEVRQPRFAGEGEEVCQLEAHLFAGRARVAEQYFREGEDILFGGHLARRSDRLVLLVDYFSFMQRGLTTRYFDHEARMESVTAA